MKKILLTAALAVATLAASAQSLYISTYAGSNLAKYDGQTRNITMSRSIFKGWNTISLPFAMSEAQVNEYFGSDCRLEKFVGVESNGSATTMLFQDVKAEGIAANTPYILYFTGDNKVVNLNIPEVTIYSASSNISFTTVNGMTISMNGANFSLDSNNRYGILAKDNDEASFVNVANLNTKFYATHCYVEVSNFDEAKTNDLVLATRHIGAGSEATAISKVVASADELIDVYNEAGQLVTAGIKARNFASLAKGLYIVNGVKVLNK